MSFEIKEILQTIEHNLNSTLDEIYKLKELPLLEETIHPIRQLETDVEEAMKCLPDLNRRYG